MTLPREDQPRRRWPGSGGAGACRAGLPRLPRTSPTAIHVEDQLQSRVRIPADLLRCVIALMEIALLAALALLARATANGAETDLVLASRYLKALLPIVGFVAHVALLLLPVALAIRMLVRRQPRRLAEAVVAGGITVGLVLAANQLLRIHAAAGLYDVLTAYRTAGSLVPASTGICPGSPPTSRSSAWPGARGGAPCSGWPSPSTGWPAW